MSEDFCGDKYINLSMRPKRAMMVYGFDLKSARDEMDAIRLVADFYAWGMSYAVNNGKPSNRRNFQLIPNFGRKSIKEVQEFVQCYGVQKAQTRKAFGYDVPIDVYRWLRSEAQRRAVN